MNDADGVRTRNLRVESPVICRLIYDAWNGVGRSRTANARGHLLYRQAGLPMPNHPGVKRKAEDSNPMPFGTARPRNSRQGETGAAPTAGFTFHVLQYPVRVTIPVLRLERALSHHSTDGAGLS